MKSALFREPRGGTARAQALAVNTLTWGYPRPVNAFTVTRTSARLEDKKQGPLVFAIFIAIQVLDGLLTYWGVTRFGIELEMNQLLAATMLEFGPRQLFSWRRAWRVVAAWCSTRTRTSVRWRLSPACAWVSPSYPGFS